MGRPRNCYIYKAIEKNGKYEITAKAELNPYTIEKMLGTVVIKNKIYEKIAVKTRYMTEPVYGLTERANLTFDVVASFVTSFSNGDRSVDSHPYTEDLLDDDLLDDVGMVVLTRKHFFSSSNHLAEVYYPVKKEKVNDELIEYLNEYSKKQEAEAVQLRHHWAEMRANEQISWIEV